MFSKLLPKIIISVFIVISFGCIPKAEDTLLTFDELKEFTTQYQELSQRYDEFIKSHPHQGKLPIELAHFYYNFRDYQKVKELLKGIDSKEAKIILAKAYARLKEYDYAIEIFEQLKPLPEDSEYLYLYAEVLEEKNLFPKAIKIYNKVTGPFKEQAQERINFIKADIEESIPPQILEVSQESEEFLEEIKDEGAVYLLVDEEIEIRPDNTSLSTIHVIEKVLKERGKELAEVEIGYDSTYQRIELEFARTITEDKKVIYAGRENIRDVSRYLNFPLYSNSRAFIVSMPSVEVGAFIEYKIKIYSSKLINEDDFTFIYRLREKYPIFKANFRIVTPPERQIHFKFFNQSYAQGIKLEPSFKEEEDKKIYSWHFRQIKSIIPEYSMPPYSLVNPAILISSFSSWDEIYKWWHSLYQDKIEASSSLEEFVKNLTKGIFSDFDKVKIIYEFVAKNIRYVAIEYGDSGYEPHYAQEVFINRYGDCKDQAILLVAMLKAAGFSAYPVLISTRSAYPIDENFASVNFNHAICAVKIEDKLIFMDPTAETTPFLDIPLSDQDRLAMVFFDSSWQLINTGQIKDNEVSYAMEILINNEENAIITRRVETQGFFASSYREYLKYTHPAIIEEDIRKKMVEISSLSRLLNYEIKNVDNFDAHPLLTYKFIAEKFLNPAGNLRIVPVLLDEAYLDYKMISKEERCFPIDFEGFYTKKATIKITLPDNLKVKYLPSSLELENPYFKFTVSYNHSSDSIDFYQEFIVKKRFVEKKEYSEFKRYFEDALYRLREEIILEKYGSEAKE